MDQSEVTEVVDALVPVIEGAIARRMEEVYGVLEELREQFQATVAVLDGNDHAIITEVQRLRGSGGEQVAETITKAAEAWERFVVTEARHIGLQVIRPKVAKEEVDDAPLADES